jgi:hypothetical protein
MSLTVEKNLANFPAGYCWQGVQEYATDLIALLTLTVPGTFTTFNFGPATPDPEFQDRPWIKTTLDGKLEGLYTYSGVWLRPHPLPPATNYIAIWKGAETDLWSFDGGDGTDPASNPPTETTGAMWVVDTDFAFRVPIGAGTNPTAYDGAQTTLTIGATGGEEKHVLDSLEHAQHNHRLDYIQTNAGPGAGIVVAQLPLGGSASNTGNQGAGDAHNNMMPFRTVHYIKRSARRYYVA